MQCLLNRDDYFAEWSKRWKFNVEKRQRNRKAVSSICSRSGQRQRPQIREFVQRLRPWLKSLRRAPGQFGPAL